HPGHPSRHRRPTLSTDPRPEDHPGRPRPARTTTVLRLHHPHQLSNPPTPKHAVVTRPQPTKTAFAQVSAHIQAIVCLSSAEVRPEHEYPFILSVVARATALLRLATL